MSGGGGTISTSEPRLGALRVQQSSYGLSLPIVYGRTRIAGNLIWYGDFTAIAHTTTTSSGGKGGGGVSQQNTTYTYEAAVLLALCEGPVSGVVSIWQAKTRYESKVIPAHLNDVDEMVPEQIQPAIEQLALSFANGTPGQPTWSHLTTNHPAQALGYTSTALLYGANFALTTNAEVENHTFEVDAKLPYGGGVVDAEPSAIVQDLLTNAQYGAAFPADSLDNLSLYSDYCRAMGLFISPAFTEQQEAREHLKTITDMTNSACVWSEGRLKIIPYGDEEVTGNGVTYSPNLTPIYDLTDDDFIVSSEGEDPVKCDRRTPADAFNQVKVEYLNRSNAYNVEIVEAKDQANIEKFGLRPRDPVKMHGICDPGVARRAAQLLLQRSLYVRNEYEFRLGWRYVLLEPMDLVTLTDVGLGLDRTPVRIISVEEDAEGLLTLRAEDYPFGVASATLYPAQAGAGFSADYNASPGNVATPVFFEPPIELAGPTGLEVWCAVSGQSALWGGCHIWSSIDGETYKKMGTVHGGARYGRLSSVLMYDQLYGLELELDGRGGQLISGTPKDAQLLNTLCWVGDENGGEFLAYQTATLTGFNSYSLSGLVRHAYDSVVATRPAGSSFVRVDDSIFKGDPIDWDLLGQAVYFKFTSFNLYGGGTQTLTEVPAYSYTITGGMLALPPSGVEGLTIAVESGGIRSTWLRCTDQDYVSTELRIGSSWSSSLVVANKNATSHFLSWQPAGQLTLLAKHIDRFENPSSGTATASIFISPPARVQISRSDVQVNTVALGWQDAKTTQPIKSYSIYTGTGGALFADCTLYGKAGSDSRSDVVIFRSAGAKRIYIVAEDMAGNLGSPSSLDVNVTLPTNFVLSSEWDANWSGAKTNAYVEADALFLPVLASESWDEHFASRGWMHTDAQAAAGYPMVFQPSGLVGSYVEQHDIGKIIASAKISVVVQSVTLSGAVTPSVLIEWSADASTWTAGPLGVTDVQATQLRHVRVTYSVTASGGDDLVKIQRVHVSVASEEKTEFAFLNISAADVNGTAYTTTKGFYDVATAVFSPSPTVLGGASPISKWSVYIDDANAPLTAAKVYVMAWDASNNRVGGAGSLQIGGY